MRSFILVGALCASGAVAAPVIIDFESYNNGGTLPTDDELIANQYNVFDYLYTTFSVTSQDQGVPAFEQVGVQEESGIESFVANRMGGYDEILAGSGDIGEFFLRGNGEAINDVGPFAFVVDFNNPSYLPSSVDFDLLDLDGNSNHGAGTGYGTEKWDVYVTDGVGNRTLVYQTPEISENKTDFDSKPLLISLMDQQGIAKIELEFAGTKQTGIGVALDNFSMDGVIPAPSSVALLGLGDIGARRRRR